MSSPETGASTVRVMYCMAISAARATIDIANPYFVPDHVSIDLFRDAVKRGVRVRVMVAGTSNDNIVARLNSVRLYGAVLEAGVELYEYNRTMMHHKIMIVDGLWWTVGTSNFDNRSFSHNEENNVSAVAKRWRIRCSSRSSAICWYAIASRWTNGSAATSGTRCSKRSPRSSRIRSRPADTESSRPDRSEHLAEEVPEPFVDLAVERSLLRPGLPRRAASRPCMSASKSRVSCAASSRS